MTEPTDMNYQPQPPNGADAPQTSTNTESSVQDSAHEPQPPDGDAPQDGSEREAENVGDADARPPLGDGAEADGSSPADWRTLRDSQTQEQLEHEMSAGHRDFDRHSYAAWVCLMHNIPRVRAFKEFVGGKEFEAKCGRLCCISKTYAHNIVSYGLAEPKILQEIWHKVHADAHSSEVRVRRYEYPTLGKMIGWYKPPDDKVGKDDEPDDVTDDDAAGSNDPRTKQQLRADLLTLMDDAKKLTARVVRAERIASETEDALARKQIELRDTMSSLGLLRQTMNEQKQVIDTRNTVIANYEAEIARLRSLRPVNDPGGGGGDGVISGFWRRGG
jgi:hypothetical protein